MRRHAVHTPQASSSSEGPATPAGEEPAVGNSFLVEFTLVDEGERTRLRVVESGLNALPWPDVDKQRYAEEHNGGWGTFLGRLVDLLAERSRG